MLSKNAKMRTAFNVIYKNIVNKITAFYLWNRSKTPFLKKTDILYENRKRNEYKGGLIKIRTCPSSFSSPSVRNIISESFLNMIYLYFFLHKIVK